MLFSKAAAAIPWSKVPKAFVEDRSKVLSFLIHTDILNYSPHYQFAGRKIDTKAAEAGLPFILSSLAAQIVTTVLAMAP